VALQLTDHQYRLINTVDANGYHQNYCFGETIKYNENLQSFECQETSKNLDNEAEMMK